jgi:hypothetical protein
MSHTGAEVSSIQISPPGFPNIYPAIFQSSLLFLLVLTLAANHSICQSRAPTTLKSEGEDSEVTSLSGADKREVTTGRSGESTERGQNISLIVPLFTFAGHYRGIRML